MKKTSAVFRDQDDEKHWNHEWHSFETLEDFIKLSGCWLTYSETSKWTNEGKLLALKTIFSGTVGELEFIVESDFSS